MATGHGTDGAGWQAVQDEVLGRFSGRFAQVKPRRTAAFVFGLFV